MGNHIERKQTNKQTKSDAAVVVRLEMYSLCMCSWLELSST